MTLPSHMGSNVVQVELVGSQRAAGFAPEREMAGASEEKPEPEVVVKDALEGSGQRAVSEKVPEVEKM